MAGLVVLFHVGNPALGAVWEIGGGVARVLRGVAVVAGRYCGGAGAGEREEEEEGEDMHRGEGGCSRD